MSAFGPTRRGGSSSTRRRRPPLPPRTPRNSRRLLPLPPQLPRIPANRTPRPLFVWPPPAPSKAPPTRASRKRSCSSARLALGCDSARPLAIRIERWIGQRRRNLGQPRLQLVHPLLDLVQPPSQLPNLRADALLARVGCSLSPLAANGGRRRAGRVRRPVSLASGGARRVGDPRPPVSRRRPPGRRPCRLRHRRRRPRLRRTRK